MTKPILAMISGFVLAFGMFVGGMLFAVAFLVPGEASREPVQLADGGDLWTVQPRQIDVSHENLQRVPERADPEVADASAVVGTESEIVPEMVFDDTVTASVSPEPEAAGVTADWLAEMPADPAAARLLQAHVDWCSRRYRSYQPADNTYMPYAGGQRACFSPYSAELAALTGAPVEADPHVRFVPPNAAAGVVRPPADVGRSMGSGVVVMDEGEGGDAFEVRETADETHRRPIIDRLFGERRIDVKDCSHYRTYDPADNTYQPYGGGPRRKCV